MEEGYDVLMGVVCWNVRVEVCRSVRSIMNSMLRSNMEATKQVQRILWKERKKLHKLKFDRIYIYSYILL